MRERDIKEAESENDRRHSGKRILQYLNNHGIIFSTKKKSILWKQPKCQLMDEWIKKCVCVCMCVYICVCIYIYVCVCVCIKRTVQLLKRNPAVCDHRMDVEGIM